MKKITRSCLLLFVLSVAIRCSGNSAYMPPLHYLSFVVTNDYNNNTIRWSTSSEQNNDYFLVERSSDGVSFAAIAVVKSAGNTDTVTKYFCIDRNPAIGNNYYRIHQVDLNGQSEITAIACVFVAPGNNIRVYPTVASNSICIQMPAGYENAKIILVDLSGRPMPVPITETGLWRMITLNGITASPYVIRVMNGKTVSAFEVWKQ